MTCVVPCKDVDVSESDLAGKITLYGENTSIRPKESSDSSDASSYSFTCPIPARHTSSINIVDVDDNDDEDDIGSWDDRQFGVFRKLPFLGVPDDLKPVISNPIDIPKDQFLRAMPASSDSTILENIVIGGPKVSVTTCSSISNDISGGPEFSMVDETNEVLDDELNFTSGSLPSPSFNGCAQVPSVSVICLDSDSRCPVTDTRERSGEKEVEGRPCWLDISLDNGDISAGGDTRIDVAEKVVMIKPSDPLQGISSLSNTSKYISKRFGSSGSPCNNPFSSPAVPTTTARNESLGSSSSLNLNTLNRSTPSLTADLSSSFFSSPSLADLTNPNSPLIDVDDQSHSSPLKSSRRNILFTNVKKVDMVPPAPLPPPTVSTVQDSDSELEFGTEPDVDSIVNVPFSQSRRVPFPYSAPRSSLGNRSVASLSYPKKPEPSIDSIFGVPKLDDKIACATDNSDSRMKWMDRTVPRAPRWSKRRKMTFGDSDIDSPTARKHRLRQEEYGNLELNFTAWHGKLKHEVRDLKSTPPSRIDLANNKSRFDADCSIQPTNSLTTKSSLICPSPQMNRPRKRLASPSSPACASVSSPLTQACLAKEKNRSSQAEASLRRGVFDSYSERDNSPRTSEADQIEEEEKMEEEEEQILVDKSLPLPPPSSSPTPCTPSLSAVSVFSLASCLSCTPSGIKSSLPPASIIQSSANPIEFENDNQTSEDEDSPFMGRLFTCAYTRSVSPDTSWMKQRQLSVDVPDDEDPLACVDVW
ncbi:hypothetical protein [Phaffia rhodozyma]|uniref:Uncharacterized protein n=1 Tax=Phaffia rhodozyma TaxID=264483 RepID=A0A0F7SNR1_PHARH|nr:hypothetical protein [Phaffia rhodozyma]